MQQQKNVLYSESLIFTAIIYPSIAIIAVFIGSFLISILDKVPISMFDLITGSIMIAMFLLVMINFYRLKITVTDKFIEARFGIFAHRVNISDIIEAGVYKYRFTEVMGWGIRLGFNNLIAYNVNGDNYTGVLVKFNTPKKRNRLFISSRNPQRIVDIINKIKSV